MNQHLAQLCDNILNFSCSTSLLAVAYFPDEACTCEKGCVANAEKQGKYRELDVGEKLKYPAIRMDRDWDDREANDKTDAEDHGKSFRTRQGVESVLQFSHIIFLSNAYGHVQNAPSIL